MEKANKLINQGNTNHCVFYAFINLFDKNVREALGTHAEFEDFCKNDNRILNDDNDGYSFHYLEVYLRHLKTEGRITS